MSDDAVIVQCTAASTEEAARIAQALVQQRLAACIQIMPIESWYRWNGTVHHAPEVMLHMKTMRACFERLCAVVLDLHSYDVPEIIATPVIAAAPQYLAWLREAVRN